MKKEKHSNSPPSVPQMALFETDPEPSALFESTEMVPVAQPEPVAKRPPILPASGGKKSPKPLASKPVSKPVSAPVTRKSGLTTRQVAPLKSKGSGSSAVPEGDVRLTANIRQDLHLKLKIAAARQRTTIGELIEQWVETTL